MLVFKIPSHRVKLLADLHYNAVLKRAIQDGIPTRKQMEQKVLQFGMVDFEGLAAEEDKLEHKLERATLLYNNSNHPVQRKNKKREIKSLERALQRIERKREEPFQHTAENKAEQRRTMFLVVNGIFDLDGNQRWNSVEDFVKDSKYSLQNEAIIEYVGYAAGYDTETIRSLARHPEWSIYWRSAKSTNCPIFEGTVSEWDVNKLLLVHWSQFYEDIVSQPEPPPGDILEDDDRLDRWLKEKRMVQERNARKTVATGSDGKVKTTYHVNQPYKLVTSKEVEMLEEEPDG